MAEKWNASPPRPANRPPRPAPKPTSITEAARRFHACAWALAQSLGIPLAEVLRDYSAAVSTVYIEISRCEVRLPSGVELPPLVATTPDQMAQEGPVEAVASVSPIRTNPAHEPQEALAEPLVPVVVPGGLPCSGRLIVDLKPAQLSLLLGKLEHLAEANGGPWITLLSALREERASRLAKGRRPRPVVTPVPDPASDVP